MSDKRQYTAEMKAEAVKMVLEQGLTHGEAARRLAVSKGSIVNLGRDAHTGLAKSERGELSPSELKVRFTRPEKALAESRMEREILEKAVAHFAKK